MELPIKIVEIRPMTSEEFEKEGWENYSGHNVTVLVLENGTKLYPSADYEGNGSGAIFGTDKDGKAFAI